MNFPTPHNQNHDWKELQLLSLTVGIALKPDYVCEFDEVLIA